jgi:bacillithiol biosynthesis cysteine-adding enzyme BshC
MSTECYPIATLPHTTALYRDYLAMGDSAASETDSAASPVRSWYGAEPLGAAWMRSTRPPLSIAHTAALVDALTRQALAFAAGPATLANIAKLRAGARAVVTGQQAVLFGGPLLTLLKAATAIARAKQATAATGIEHVPIFWLATEDHDLEEVDQVSLLTRTSVETLRLGAIFPNHDAPVGDLPLGPAIDALLDQAAALLNHAPICDLLRECCAPQPADAPPTFASAIARLITRLFAAHGLIVMDASGRDLHSLGAPALRYAIEHAASLEAALLARTIELETAGYHAQVLVKPGASLLFLISEVQATPGIKHRQPLRRLPDGSWRAGSGNSAATYSTSDLLAILDTAPERLSPNAILRPVFQDTILPTTAYVGGPAEVAYFAQSAVLYQRIFANGDTPGRITPVLPRLSATLIEPAIAAVMAQHELSLPDAFTTPEELAQRLGARAMPIEAKRRLASAGNALDGALAAAEHYLASLDPDLGRSAQVSASKMRYQMDRLRRLAATFELNKETSLRKHADAIALHLFPNGHPQERVLACVWFLAAWEAAHGDAPGATPVAGLIDLLVSEAASQCPGHIVIRL